MTDLRTPLSQVRGHGAAKEGVKHHIAARVSAIALALILPFFIWGLMKALPGGYDGILAWVGSAGGAFTLLVFVTAGLYHGRLGMNEVILDYAGSHGSRTFFMLANALASFGFWLVGVLAILKIWLGA
jgi:succinate dehydrogenase / fumarate reductase membrane anchor subunit